MITVSRGPCDSPAVRNRSVMWAASYRRLRGVSADRSPGRPFQRGPHHGQGCRSPGPDLEGGSPLVEEHSQAVDGPGAGVARGPEQGGPDRLVDEVDNHLPRRQPPRVEGDARSIHPDRGGVDDQVDGALGEDAVDLAEGYRAAPLWAKQ